ncbi:MAG: alanine--tRNA ligase [Lachnospiraceae bacterium]|nr:alanine--tRNA ligase [Lachnospiraceae bacterium]
MKQFTSNELRTAWKEFYKARGHVDAGAVSLVSDGSTGAMFNVAGMQPLMPYLLGRKHPMGTRLCNVQGCVRTNDLDNIGDLSHLSFFEMMGSWSLGDYFKEERCKWSFELLTQVFGFDADHLAATVFAGDENAPRDEEGAAFRIASGFKPEHIYYLPAEDNWWGLEYGPCGPDSEMFYIADVPDCGPNCGPGCSCGKYTELGNDVFMQYEKHKDGHLTELSQKNVDTGWGLERILAFLNGTKDVYQTDVFLPVIDFLGQCAGTKYGADEKLTRSMRIVADHVRTSVMLIGDSARLLPSNAGAGYVLRRLIRRAVRHGRILGLGQEQILKAATIYIDQIYNESYPNLVQNKTFILEELSREITRFEATLENGMKEFAKLLEQKKAENAKELDGKSAFYLYDTFGFPIELTVELAEEQGLGVDEQGFAQAMKAQKELARSNQNFSAKLSTNEALFDKLDASLVSTFVGYEGTECSDSILAIAGADALKEVAEEGEQATVITGKTPFYATMGGQKGDRGVIKTAGGTFEVSETIKLPGGRIGHVGVVTAGRIATGDAAELTVDAQERRMTCSNHTATHLLQKALREVLGDSVEQQGSYQDDTRTRFDFSYGQAMTAEQLKEVERIVGEKISLGLDVVTKEMSLEEAKKTGAMALFGEKYGDVVRVVNIGDWSIELCGGTHVKNTSAIGCFKILSESGVAAGVRRIEAITGSNVLSYYAQIEESLAKAAATVKATPQTLQDRLEHLCAEVKELRSENESLKAKAAQDSLGNALDNVTEVKGVKLLATAVDGASMNALRDLGDQLKAKIGEGVVVLLSEENGKVNMIAMATDGAVAAGAHAGNLIKGIAALVGGGGGGRPNMAQAGGKNPAGIPQAVKEAATVLEGML